MGKTNIRIEKVGKGGLPPLAAQLLLSLEFREGQRGQATLPNLFYSNV